MKYDLIIIGAGPGGYECAVEAARYGLSVAIVEKDKLGGTCLNVGCIPTKCLCHSAEVINRLKEADMLGIETGEIKFNLEKAIARKNDVVNKLNAGIEALLKTPGITLYNGEAQFTEPKKIVLNNDTRTELEAENIILALGSVTKFLPIEGAHTEGVATSTEMLALESVPKRLCVIGGGVIGLEFASIYNAFGSEVTVIEFMKEILPFFDKDLAKRLRSSLKKKGINFKTGAEVSRIEKTNELFQISFEEKGKLSTLDADLVLMAVGRVANVKGINLDDVGIQYTARGIETNEHFETNIKGIYAIGDVNGKMQLAHAATYQGFKALDHLKKANRTQMEVCPAVVFTEPELAMVGKTEEQLVTENKEYKTYKSFYRANGKALTMAADDGLVKILTSPEGVILGAHILGAHSADLIHEVAVLMQKKGTIMDIKDTIHAHPTLSEIVMNVQ